MRAKPLFETAVQEATSSLLPALEELTGRKIHRYQVQKIAEDTIRAYQAVARDQERSRVSGFVSDETRKLAALEVGRHVIVVPQPFQSLRGRMATARKIMDNPDAKWKCETVAEGIKITRTIDGARFWRDPTKNAKAVEMAEMKAGERKIAKTILTAKGHGQMGTNTKIAARKILDCPTADWSVKTTERGILLTRIA